MSGVSEWIAGEKENRNSTMTMADLRKAARRMHMGREKWILAVAGIELGCFQLDDLQFIANPNVSIIQAENYLHAKRNR